DHLKAEILGALLDAVHGALARAQTLGELGLREATMLTCAADQGSDLRGIHRGDRSGERSFGAGDSHDDDPNSHMRYGRTTSRTSQVEERGVLEVDALGLEHAQLGPRASPRREPAHTAARGEH